MKKYFALITYKTARREILSHAEETQRAESNIKYRRLETVIDIKTPTVDEIRAVLRENNTKRKATK